MSVRDRIRGWRAQPVKVETPTGDYWIMPMVSRRRDAYIQRIMDRETRPLTQTEIAAWALWDDEKSQLAYDPANAADIAELAEFDGGSVGLIVNKFLVASLIMDDPVAGAEKKSESSQSSDSGTGSPLPSVAQ